MKRVIALLVANVCCGAQVLSKPLAAAQVASVQSRMSPALIPEFTEMLEVQAQQAFDVTMPGAPEVWVVPVTYDAKFEEGERQRCGLFAFAGRDKVSFVETFGPNLNDSLECDGTKAVGFMASGAGRPPRVLVRVGASLLISMGNTERTNYMLALDWDAGHQGYALNKVLSDRLYKERRPTSTIAEAKRLIESYETER